MASGLDAVDLSVCAAAELLDPELALLEEPLPSFTVGVKKLRNVAAPPFACV